MKTRVPSNNWIFIMPVAALVVAYAYFFFFLGEKSVRGFHEELAAVTEEIDEAEAFRAAIEATREQFEKTDEYVRRWEESAPSEEEWSGLFGRLNRLAKDSGATTTRFEPQLAVDYDKIRQVPVALACVGSFPQISAFLRDLESLRETIWIESLKMERPSEDSENVQCQLALAIFSDKPDDSDQVDRAE